MTISNAPDRDLTEIVAEHLALEILRVLSSDAAAGAANARVLETYMKAIALARSSEDIGQALQKLELAKLVRLSRVDEFTIAEITDKGERVACGKEKVDGVARPSRDAGAA